MNEGREGETWYSRGRRWKGGRVECTKCNDATHFDRGVPSIFHPSRVIIGVHDHHTIAILQLEGPVYIHYTCTSVHTYIV